ncbi:MAG: ATP-binding cassette domain-containing protein [Proteobacteria bacterium]|nr:ATP-binding cassette domain-containing protein [Pseudomonadota bacterium]
MQALAACSVAHHACRSVDVVSGGELARVRLAQALAMKPQLLILDEPDAALDQQARLELHALLRSLPATVVFVSHDLASAQQHADRVWELRDGRLHARV